MSARRLALRLFAERLYAIEHSLAFLADELRLSGRGDLADLLAEAYRLVSEVRRLIEDGCDLEVAREVVSSCRGR